MIQYKSDQFSEVNGKKIAYYREGSGETVLLVHGITTASFIWQDLLPHLSKSFDVIAIDLLGCGNSDKSLDIVYSLNNHAELLHEFLIDLNIKKFHFVGHDVGGGIGQIFAVRYPQMLYDLTLINSVGYEFWPVQPIIAMRIPILRQLAMATLDFGTYKMVLRRALYHKDKLTPELFDQFLMQMKTRLGRKAFLHFANCLDNRNLTDIEKELQELDMPVIIFRGDADIYLSKAISEQLYHDISNSELVAIKTGGHFLQVDEPEILARELSRFFGKANDAKD